MVECVREIGELKVKSHPVHAFNQETITKEYEALKRRVHKQAADDPDAIIPLSNSGIHTISEYMSIDANSKAKQPFLSEEHDTDFFLADTFLRHSALTSRTFYVQGNGVFKGGDINYIGVGALAGRYGYSEGTTKALVIGHNVSQWVAGEGSHNLNQIGPGNAWAQYGRNYYNNR